MKEHVHGWLTEKMKIPGMLACGLRAAEPQDLYAQRVRPVHPCGALEYACRCLADTFLILAHQ